MVRCRSVRAEIPRLLMDFAAVLNELHLRTANRPNLYAPLALHCDAPPVAMPLCDAQAPTHIRASSMLVLACVYWITRQD